MTPKIVLYYLSFNVFVLYLLLQMADNMNYGRECGQKIDHLTPMPIDKKYLNPYKLQLIIV